MGIIISTAVSKKAVIRNRLKRQLREILKATVKQMTNKSWLVVVVFPSAPSVSGEELKKELLSLCAKAGIIL